MEIAKKRIYFFCPTLGSGGAERVVIRLLTHLDRQKYRPGLVLLARKGEYISRVPADVPVIDLKKRHKGDFFKALFLLAFRVLPRERPAVLISFLEYNNLLAILAVLIAPWKPRLIISERTTPSREQEHKRLGRLRRLLIRLLYPLADRIIAVSQGVALDLINSFHIPAARIKVVYNGIDAEEVGRQAAAEISESAFPAFPVFPVATMTGDGRHGGQPLTLVACGRLVKAKNFPLLLTAYALAKKSLSPARESRLFIIGEGEERPVLAAMIGRLGLSRDVSLLGYQANPFPFIARADIFISSSDYEGFPNTLLEALACRTAVIATDCCSGPAEIIEHGVSGRLVPVNAAGQLAAAIRELAADAGLRARLAQAGLKRLAVFSLGRMLAGYESLIAEQLKLR